MLRLPLRSDIDGLRGLAMLAVLLCHYGTPGISGGYIGIDVFFTIAGFLTARGILGEIREGTWSYGDFYGRRVRRLFPALLATLVASLVVAPFLLMPAELQWLGATAFGSVLGLSNILYWSELSYFGASAAHTPLLSTWAISVSAQLYLVWPVLMLGILGRNGSRIRLALLVATLILASGLSIWAGQAMLEIDAWAAFYLTPFRLAAFAVGALLVWLPRLPESWRRAEEWLLVAGLASLFYGILAFGPKTPFPGINLLLPTLGTALVLYAGQAPRAGALLRQPLLVWLGLLSYPLYLVHWPLLGFVQAGLLRPIAGWEIPALGFAALGLAWILARFVERPFRVAPGQPRRPSSPAFGLACAGLAMGLMTVSALVRTGDGWTWRIPAEVRPAIVGLEFSRKSREAANRVGVCHLNMWVGQTALGSYVDERCMRIDPERPNYLIIGDSHGGDRYAGLSAAYPEVNFLQMTTASCRPLLDTDFTDYQCPARMDYVFRRFLPGAPLDGAILVGRWQARDLGRLRATLKHLRGLGHRTILIGPAVEIVPWVPDLVFRHGRRAGLEEQVSRFIVPERLEMDRRMRALAAEEGAEYYSAIDALCPDLRCPVLSSEGRLLIVDYGHQSPEGALVQAQGLKRLGLALPRRQPVRGTACGAVAHSPAGD